MTLRSLAPLALALVLLPVPAAADNTADEADLHFRRGVEAYRAKRFDDALVAFFQSNRLVRNLNVVHNIARSYEQLKMYDEAYRYYREVLGGLQAGEERRAVEEGLARIAPRVALLTVTTNPPGAEIYVGRKDLGSLGAAPQTLALPPGKSTVILSLPGHREEKREVQLAVGRTAALEVPLEFVWARARLEGEPEGAEVRVDTAEGPAEGRVPGVVRLKPGRHILNLSAPGFVSAQLPVELQPDQEISLPAVRLQAMPTPTGSVVVTSNHEGALVRVDGKDSGFTPAVLTLPAGRHRVEVSMTDMRTFSREVEVGASATVQLRAELRFGGAKTTAASKTETSVDEAPASITLITRDEIRAFGYQTLGEALRGVRGVFTSNDRQYENLGMRGFAPPGDNNNRLLVLYDGHQVGDIVGGSSYVGRDLDIDLTEVDRIEVVRGPVSSLYGTSAFFGVVNVVPRRNLGEHYVEGSANAGALGQVGGRATGAYKGGGVDVLVSAGGVRIRGDELFQVPLDPPALVRDRDVETAFHGTARARWKGLSLLADVNSRAKQLPTGAFNSLLDQRGTQVLDQRAVVELRYEHAFASGGNLAARVYYDATRYEGKWQYAEGEQTDWTSGDWGGVEVRYRTFEFLRQHVTVGLDVQQQFRLAMKVMTGENQGIDDSRSFTVLSAYLADELRIADEFLVNASVRADEYLGSFGFTVNPRLALIGKPWSGGVTKLMGGRSFRAPSAYERYYHDGIVNPVTGEVDRYLSIKPNPDLKPEVIYTVELEHAQEIGDLKVVGALYVNFLSDLLQDAPDPADGLLRSVNAPGLVRTQGAELELRWQPQRLAVVSAAYSFQQMIITGISDPDERARLRANAPGHMFSLRAMFPLAAPFVVGSAEAVFNSARPLREGTGTSGEFLLLNVGLSGELPGGHFRYFAGARNLLDQRAQLPAGTDLPALTTPTYGRTFVLQVSAAY